MRLMKRMLCLLLALLLVFSVPLGAMAEAPPEETEAPETTETVETTEAATEVAEEATSPPQRPLQKKQKTRQKIFQLNQKMTAFWMPIPTPPPRTALCCSTTRTTATILPG